MYTLGGSAIIINIIIQLRVKMENAGTDAGELADWFQSQREHKATSAKL